MSAKFCQEVIDKEAWESFLLNVQEKTFLQSWNWGEFQRMMGNKIWRLGIYENDKLIGGALVTKIVAKRGTFLLIQHGPVVKNPKSEILNSKPRSNPFGMLRGRQIQNSKFQILNVLLEKLKKIAKEEKASFIRVAPLFKRNEENKKLFRDLGFREAPMHASAYEATLKLDLRLSEEELLMNMRKTTRYLIRQALKNPDLEIIKSNRTEDVELYDKLNQEVAKHQQFVPFSFEFIRNQFDVFVKDNQALLFFGKYQEKIIASAMIIFWSGIGFYHYAALSPAYHKIPIAYLLQWEAIKEAKKRESVLYDFWGFVDPKQNYKHPWVGPTLFKMGFGGRPYEYLKTQDLPLSKKYWLTCIFEKLRKRKRGL